MPDRLSSLFLPLFFFLLACVTAPLFYWAIIDRRVPLVIEREVNHPLNGKVGNGNMIKAFAPGDIMDAPFYFHMKWPERNTIRRYIVCREEVTPTRDEPPLPRVYTLGTGSMPRTETDEVPSFSFPIPIPSDIVTPSTCRYQAEVDFHLNQLRTVTVSLPTIYFRVVGADELATMRRPGRPFKAR